VNKARRLSRAAVFATALLLHGCASCTRTAPPHAQPNPDPPPSTPAEVQLLETQRNIEDLRFKSAVQEADKGLATLQPSDSESTRRELQFARALAFQRNAEELAAQNASADRRDAALASAESQYRTLLDSGQSRPPSTLGNLAAVVAARGKRGEAVDLLREAAAQNPINDAAYENRLGELLQETNWQEAAEHLQAAAFADMGNIEPVERLLTILAEHAPERAGRLADDAAEHSPAPFAIDVISRVLDDDRLRGGHDEAAIALARAITQEVEFNPDTASVAKRLARAPNDPPRRELVELLADPDPARVVWWRGNSNAAPAALRLDAFRNLAVRLGAAASARGDHPLSGRFYELAESVTSSFSPRAAAALVSFYGTDNLKKVDDVVTSHRAETNSARRDRDLYDYHRAAGATYALTERWCDPEVPERTAAAHLEEAVRLAHELQIVMPPRLVQLVFTERAKQNAGVCTLKGQPLTALATHDTVIVHFEKGSPELTEETKQALMALAEQLRNHTNVVQLDGHASSEGSSDFNDWLSEARAKKAEIFLREYGIIDARIQATGHGSREPARSNETEEGREYNRRVECRIE